MANPSYYARTLLSGDDLFAVEQPASVPAAHPYFDLPMVLGVFNTTGSGKIVRVRFFNTRSMTTAQSTTAMLNIQRISAASEPVFGMTIPALPLDSANAALPSQVECLYAPRVVTVVGGSVMRRVMVQPQTNMTRALSVFISQGQGDSRSGNDSGEFYRASDADATRIVIAEGEGIGLDYATTNGMALHAYSVTFIVREATSGECYRFNRVIEPRQADIGMVMTLMNKVGSGVVLEVSRIQILEVGTDEEPQVQYERIEWLDPAAEVPDLTAMDSATPLDAGVLVRMNALAVRAGAKVGGLVTNPMIRRVQVSESPWYVGSPGLGGLTRRARFVPDVQFEAGTAFVLREGEGVAMRKSNPSAKCSHEVQLLFDVADAVAGFPAADDVRDGVVYGASGEFDGDLVVPAEADVRLGTGYGADGTEFTGTLDPGSGGGGGGTGTVFLRRGR